MKIKTEQHPYNAYEGVCFTALDDDTYDGADDSNCPVGWGHTEREAINDLVEQIVEELENMIDDLRHENRCLRLELDGEGERTVRAINQAVLSRLYQRSPQTRDDADRGGASGPEVGTTPSSEIRRAGIDS